YPKSRSAAAFQVWMIPSRDLLMMASSEDSTIDASRRAARSCSADKGTSGPLLTDGEVNGSAMGITSPGQGLTDDSTRGPGPCLSDTGQKAVDWHCVCSTLQTDGPGCFGGVSPAPQGESNMTSRTQRRRIGNRLLDCVPAEELDALRPLWDVVT